MPWLLKKTRDHNFEALGRHMGDCGSQGLFSSMSPLFWSPCVAAYGSHARLLDSGPETVLNLGSLVLEDPAYRGHVQHRCEANMEEL